MSNSFQLYELQPARDKNVHGRINQARTLEWVAISFSRDLSNPGSKPTSYMSPALAGRFFVTSTTWEALMLLLLLLLLLLSYFSHVRLCATP